MVFSSYLFIFLFLPLALFLCYVSGKKYRNAVLAVVSYLFYGWSDPRFMLLMFATTLVDYTDGWLLQKYPEKKKLFLAFSLLFDLGVLGYFKYFNFGMENWSLLMANLGIPEWQFSGFFRIILPLGISFYTFQSLSYVLDLYYGTAEPAASFGDYACYVSMFPQLVAGPILRFTEVSAQLRERTCSWKKFARGCAFFMLGLGKKVLLANPCGKLADQAFSALDLPVFDAWFGMVAYAFQIYFDFSGYSDMAVGLGLMLGFVFPKNFDSPYRSRSITEYWQKWHISLSSWLKDYWFYVLLRSRWCMGLTGFLSGKGYKKLSRTLPTALALVILWFTIGLWHGASWTFVIFGLYHGLFIILELCVSEFRKKKRDTETAGKQVWSVVLTFVLACFGHVFFRADTLSDAGHYFASLAGVPAGISLPGTVVRCFTLNPYYLGIFIVSGIVVWTMPQVWDFTRKLTILKMTWCIIVFILSVLALSVQSYNPFIYFIF